MAKSTKVIIQGSTRFQPPVWFLNQRSERNRCSSIPSCITSLGRCLRAVANVSAAVVVWRCTVGQETPNWDATRSTARTSPATALVIASFNRVVTLALVGTWRVASVNLRRAQRTSMQRQRFLIHTTSISPSKGTSRTRWRVRWWTRPVSTPQPG